MYGLDRWSEEMLPHIKLEMWAKSSQWAVLSRRLGRVVDADNLVIELFAKHCLPGRRCVGDVSALSFSSARQLKCKPFNVPCYELLNSDGLPFVIICI